MNGIVLDDRVLDELRRRNPRLTADRAEFLALTRHH